MRVAILSYAYSPSVGGIERVSELIANQLSARGWEVRLVTQTPGPAEKNVIRRPRTRDLISILRWADVILESNLSVGLSWPAALGIVRTPRVTVLHAPISLSTGKRRLRDRTKVMMLPRRTTYTVSRWLGQTLPLRTRFMPNPYDGDVFFESNEPRSREILFVGRLVGAKGLDAAMQAIERAGERWRLTVIGDGPDREMLEKRARTSGIYAEFLGAQGAQRIAHEMRSHRVLIVPSTVSPPEVFPLVALEGIACGCHVVATRSGGLPEAVGQMGTVVDVGDIDAMTEALARAVVAIGFPASQKADHLAAHSLDQVTEAYQVALRDAVRHPD